MFDVSCCVATGQRLCECRHPKCARVSTSEMCVRVDIQNAREHLHPKYALVSASEMCASVNTRNMRGLRQPKYARTTIAEICANGDSRNMCGLRRRNMCGVRQPKYVRPSTTVDTRTNFDTNARNVMRRSQSPRTKVFEVPPASPPGKNSTQGNTGEFSYRDVENVSKRPSPTRPNSNPFLFF